MATPVINTDYLKFDAFSIRDLIRQKLSEDPTFTDYVYEGSNLSIIIDIVSNMYQVLMYNLNHAAAESMISDTQIYENISRLVKFIGYNPRGYSTSSTQMTVNMTNMGGNNTIILPPYFTVTLDKTDKEGNSIDYSTVDYYHLYQTVAMNTETDISNIVTMYNGKWNKYTTTIVSEGIPFEKFVLDGLVSDSTDTITPSYIAYPYVDVYIKRKKTDNYFETIKFSPNTDGLFLSSSDNSFIESNSKIFALRLNEFKQYEIQFGDGICGEMLKKGDIVNVIYLKSNGSEGIIEISDVQQKKGTNLFKIQGVIDYNESENQDEQGQSLTMRNIADCLFTDASVLTALESTNYISNLGKSTTSVTEESVEEVKQNAPNWFKSVGRLISPSDFEYFIKTQFYNEVIDIKVMNNWEYMCSFYKWLYVRGLLSTEKSGSKYINSNLSSNYGYKYADAADSNNVYVWLKVKNESSSLINDIEEKTRPLKPLTSEIICMYPLKKYFFPCISIPSGYDIENWDSLIENYLEIEVDKNIAMSFESVKKTVANYITEFFADANQKMGGIVDLAELSSILMGIEGVKKIRTVWVNPNNALDIKYVDGLTFVCWTPDIIQGEDIGLTNSSFTLEPFQVAELTPTASVFNYIKVITETAYGTNHIEY